MFTKQDLKQFLEEISQNAVFVKFQFASTEKFAVQLKCKVGEAEDTAEVYNKYASEWIKKFSNFTATAWIVRNSYPKLKRLLYRKLFCCHRSAFNKKTQCSDDTRNQGCRARIDFKMKFINRNTMKNDPYLKEGLNMTISVDFLHSHKVRTQKAVNLLKSTPETDEMFYSYFDNGYTPAVAKLYHELTVINSYGDEPQYLMNSNINPKTHHIHYLHTKTRKAGTIVNKTFEDIMSSKKAKLERAGGFLSYDNSKVITVITPTMRRVILAINLDHILVDSVPIPSGPVVTFLYAVSKAGALPIACVLHTEEDEANYSQAFLSIKLILENLLNAQFEPKLLNITDCKNIRNAATSIFPNCIVLSSKWSVCSNVWSWICNDSPIVDNSKRIALMENFCDMIRCNNLELGQKCYDLFSEDDDDEAWPSDVIDYVDDLWSRRVEWLNAEDNVSMNVVEASMRLMNEFVHQRCKSFNIQVMIDVLINIIDTHIRYILHAHVKGLNVASAYTKLLEKSKEVLNQDPTLKKVYTNEFRLECRTKQNKYIRFNTDNWCCDCIAGKKGRFCDHLCAVVNVIDTDLMNTSELTDEEKCLLTEIAGGELEGKCVVKPEFIEEDEEEMDIDDVRGDNEVENVDDEIDLSLDSPKSADDSYYYLEVKTEDYGGDPLDAATEVSVEEKCKKISCLSRNVPSTSNKVPRSSNTTTVDLKSQYEGAMTALNNEFRRLNKYFKDNPNRSNMETMIRLAKELNKIRPIERVDFGNMHIQVNTTDGNQS